MPLLPAYSGGQDVLLTCRAGYENALRHEVEEVLKQKPLCQGAGWLCYPYQAFRRPPQAFVFERQRMMPVNWLAFTRPHTLSQQLLTACDQQHALVQGLAWRCDCFLLEANPPKGSVKSLHALKRALHGEVKTKHFHPGFQSRWETDLKPPRWVLQVALLEDRAGFCWMRGHHLTHPAPGGMPRLRIPSESPSRSAVKVEEALLLMEKMPAPRERVVDLGASPGGWTHAFVRRGCRVLAVDRGPLKLMPAETLAGEWDWIGEDGLRFRPPAPWLPVDWLLCDMLISPGRALAILRKWVLGHLTKHFIVNLKLPQKQPWVPLAEVERLLRDLSGCRWQMRQLYHDRKEVTLMGSFK